MSAHTAKKASFAIICAALLLNAILWFAAWKGFPDDEQGSGGAMTYIIRYSVLTGADFYGTKQDVVFIPLLGFLLLALNAVLSFFMLRKEIILALLFAFFGAAAQIMLLVGLAALIRFNFNNPIF